MAKTLKLGWSEKEEPQWKVVTSEMQEEYFRKRLGLAALESWSRNKLKISLGLPKKKIMVTS